MQESRSEHDDRFLLPPFPEGWYFVASRQALSKRKLIQKRWMGREIVAWCDDEGRICVAEAVCPHLGAELGPDAGGRVRNGALVCPFHGFEYDVTGRCIATPFAPPPQAARLRVFETRSVLDLVFAWWGSGGRPPQWRLPADPPGGTNWGGMDFWTVRFPGHPQETTENAVDLAHLRYAHGYRSVNRAEGMSVDGAYLKSCFDFKRTRSIAGIASLEYDVSAVTHVYGLGYSFVEVHERSFDMKARLWVLATPVDGTLIEVVLVGQVREIRAPKRPIVGMRFLPARLRTAIMRKIIMAAQRRDVLQDVAIWSRKRYRTRPYLSRSDGEIGKYRRYSKQFYPDRPDDARDRLRPSAGSCGGSDRRVLQPESGTALPRIP